MTGRLRTGGTTRPAAAIDQEGLLEKILQARPGATMREVARIAPTLADVPPKELEARMARVRQRRFQGR